MVTARAGTLMDSEGEGEGEGEIQHDSASAVRDPWDVTIIYLRIAVGCTEISVSACKDRGCQCNIRMRVERWREDLGEWREELGDCFRREVHTR